MMKKLFNNLYFPIIKGTILNIGCGEDSIIYREYGSRKVTNIDNSIEKIKNSPYPVINMDARHLIYNNNTWKNITSFFTFGYLFYNKSKEEAIKEIYRVLETGGKFYLWDMNIKTSNPYIKIQYKDLVKMFMVKNVSDKQNLRYFKRICKKAGFKIIKIKNYFSHFYIECEK